MGDASDLRRWLEAEGHSYVLAVSSHHAIWRDGVLERVDALVAAVPAAAWASLSAGEGSRGERLYDWTCLRLPFPTADGHAQWLLARRSLSDATELAYYRAFGPAETDLAELDHTAGMRWAVEECFEEAKGLVGLDQYEVRKWTAWYRHFTLALLVHAYLAVQRVHAQRQELEQEQEKRGRPDQPDLIPLTVPEVRRLLLTVTEPSARSTFRLAWSLFRRRHQAGAKRCHAARRARQYRLAPGSPAIHWLPARRFELSAEQWARVVRLLPPQKPRTGRPNHDHRTFLAGMRWIVQTGSAWRELPEELGPWQTVYGRYQRWRRAGIWQQVLDLLSQGSASAPAEVSL